MHRTRSRAGYSTAHRARRNGPRWRWWGLAALLLLFAVACSRPAAPLPAAPLPSPTPATPVVFPADAGPHDALTEWWYYTGHLKSETDGSLYGFEFTIFQVRRQGAPTGYLAHFAVSDLNGRRFSHQSRIMQGEPAPTFPVDVDGWRLSTDGSADVIQAAMHAAPGADPSFGVQLRLTDEKPPALHHDGYIEYGSAGGSYYYSRTRLDVSGQLQRADGEAVPVTGLAWMDHQWGNFVVASAGGWDWYSLQLDDRSELMLYMLRAPDGETTTVYGTQVLPDGTTRDLAPGSVQAQATGSWTSPHTGAVYPSGWQLTLPDAAHLTLQPQLVDQELYFPELGAQGVAATSRVGTPNSAANSSPPVGTDRTASGGGAGVGTMAYWEGAVTVSGDRSGVGYVELTGYAGR